MKLFDWINNKIKRAKCEHSYEYVNKYTPHMMYPNLEGTRNYIFKCTKCGEIRKIDNYEVIESIQDLFMKCLNEELLKDSSLRMNKDDFYNEVWNRFSEYKEINETLKKEISPEPLYFKYMKSLSEIDDSYILSLKFKVDGAWTIYDLIGRELKSNIPYLIYKSTKGKYESIRYYKFTIELEEEEIKLYGNYLDRGIVKSQEEIKEEAKNNVCKSFNIMYVKGE